MNFNYRKALKVPYLIQKLYKDVYLRKPLSLLAIGLFLLSLLVSALFLSFLFVIMPNASFLYVLIYLVIPFVMTKGLLMAYTDGKNIFTYIYDFISWYIKFDVLGQKRNIYDERLELEDKVRYEIPQLKESE